MNTSKAREERLAAALRQNLRRRKAQSASRDADSGEAAPEAETTPGVAAKKTAGERDTER